MLKYELKKIISCRIIILLLIVNCLFVFIFYVGMKGVKLGNETQILMEVGAKYEGKLTIEKITEINSMYEEMKYILSVEHEYRQAYLAEQMSRDEYLEYSSKLHNYKAKEQVIEKFKAKVDRVYELNGDYLFDGYYNYFLNPVRLPWLMWFMSLVVAMAFIFSRNKSLAAVETATVKSLNYVYKEKRKAVLICELAVGLIYTLEEIVFFSCFDAFDNMTSPIISIEKLQKIGCIINGPIWCFVFLRGCIMVISCMIMGYILQCLYEKLDFSV